MKLFICSMMCVFLFCFQSASWSAAGQSIESTRENTPVGLWKTIDDVTGKAKSIVEITQSPNHTLSGKVVKLFKGSLETCLACSGDKHNQPVLGMVVMSGLKINKEEAGEWIDGSVLDPKNGKTYHCRLHLSDNGQQLNVRGYIGIPLFGRSQNWERVTSLN